VTDTLYQLVDLTVLEAHGIKGFVEVDDEGRHLLSLHEAESPCEKCRAEAELIETTDGYSAATQPTYTIPARGSPALCREHLAEEPTHVGFTTTTGDEVADDER